MTPHGAPFPTTIEYRTDPADGFGEAKEVFINGQPVTAVKRIEVDQGEGEFNRVVITLRGVHVIANKPITTDIPPV